MDLKSINIELENYSAEKWLNTRSEKLNYRLRIPDKIDRKKKYPLLVYFHGSGGRGDDNRSQLTDAGAIEAFYNQHLYFGRTGTKKRKMGKRTMGKPNT